MTRTEFIHAYVIRGMLRESRAMRKELRKAQRRQDMHRLAVDAFHLQAEHMRAAAKRLESEAFEWCAAIRDGFFDREKPE